LIVIVRLLAGMRNTLPTANIQVSFPSADFALSQSERRKRGGYGTLERNSEVV
jgi:hypothetical protein